MAWSRDGRRAQSIVVTVWSLSRQTRIHCRISVRQTAGHRRVLRGEARRHWNGKALASHEPDALEATTRCEVNSERRCEARALAYFSTYLLTFGILWPKTSEIGASRLGPPPATHQAAIPSDPSNSAAAAHPATPPLRHSWQLARPARRAPQGPTPAQRPHRPGDRDVRERQRRRPVQSPELSEVDSAGTSRSLLAGAGWRRRSRLAERREDVDGSGG